MKNYLILCFCLVIVSLQSQAQAKVQMVIGASFNMPTDWSYIELEPNSLEIIKGPSGLSFVVPYIQKESRGSTVTDTLRLYAKENELSGPPVVTELKTKNGKKIVRFAYAHPYHKNRISILYGTVNRQNEIVTIYPHRLSKPPRGAYSLVDASFSKEEAQEADDFIAANLIVY